MSSSSPNFKTAHDWHVYYVFNDPDFKAGVETLTALEKRVGEGKQLKDFQHRLAERFGVNPYDIFRYRSGEIIPLSHETSSAELHIDPFKKLFSIKFGPFTSRAEMLEQWKKFEEFRAAMFPQKVTKRKPPKRPELIYAVFKQRHQKGQSFPEIFKLYLAGNLPGYDGPADLQDEEILERLYNEHKPPGV